MSYLEIAQKAKPFIDRGVTMHGLFQQKPLPIVKGAISFLEKSTELGFTSTQELQQILEDSLASLTIVNDKESLLGVTPCANANSPFEIVRKLLWVSKNYPECDFCNIRGNFSIANLKEMVDSVEYHRYLGTPREAILEELLKGFVKPQEATQEVSHEEQPNLEASELHSSSSDLSIPASSDVHEDEGRPEEGGSVEEDARESDEDSSGYYVVEEFEKVEEILDELEEEESNPLPFEISDKVFHLSSKLPAHLQKSHQMRQLGEDGSPLRKRVAFYPNTWWVPEAWTELNAEEIILGFNCPAVDSAGIAKSLMTQPFMKEFVREKGFQRVSRSSLGKHTIPHFKKKDVEDFVPTIKQWLLAAIDGEGNPAIAVNGEPRFTMEVQKHNFWSWLRQLYHGADVDLGVNNNLASVTTGEHNPIMYARVYDSHFLHAFGEALATLGDALSSLYLGVPVTSKDSDEVVYMKQKTYELNSSFTFGGWMEAVYRETLNLFAFDLKQKALLNVNKLSYVESENAYNNALANFSKKELARALKLYHFNTPASVDTYLDRLDGVISKRCMKLVHGHRQTPFKGLHYSRNNMPIFPLAHFHILEYFFLLTNLAPNSIEKYNDLGN